MIVFRHVCVGRANNVPPGIFVAARKPGVSDCPVAADALPGLQTGPTDSQGCAVFV